MNTGWSAFHLVNTYGAFGSVGRVRSEVVFSATAEGDAAAAAADNSVWLEFEFKCKPGALSRRPCIITPWHYRLDWLAWFAAMGTYRHYPWTVRLADKLVGGRSESALEPAQGAPAASKTLTERLSVSLTRLLVARDAQDLLAFDPFDGSGVRPACTYVSLAIRADDVTMPVRRERTRVVQLHLAFEAVRPVLAHCR
jgi:hypothetical protein